MGNYVLEKKRKLQTLSQIAFNKLNVSSCDISQFPWLFEKKKGCTHIINSQLKAYAG